VPTAHKLNSFD